MILSVNVKEIIQKDKIPHPHMTFLCGTFCGDILKNVLLPYKESKWGPNSVIIID